MAITTLNHRHCSPRSLSPLQKTTTASSSTAVEYARQSSDEDDKKCKRMTAAKPWTKLRQKSTQRLAMLSFLSVLLCGWAMLSLLGIEQGGVGRFLSLLDNYRPQRMATLSLFFPTRRQRHEFPRVFRASLSTNQTSPSYQDLSRRTEPRRSSSSSSSSNLRTKDSNSQFVRLVRRVNPMISKKQAAAIAKSEDYEVASIDTAETKDCKMQYSWQTESKFTCNLMHETDMTNVKILDSGHWRDVWLTQGQGPDQQPEAVLKTQRLEHGFSDRSNIDRNRRDAMAMEHFTASPWILNVYSYCTTSSMAEMAPYGSIENKIWPSSSSSDNKDSEDSRDQDQKEDEISMEFLKLAVQATIAVAEVHNFDMEGKPAIVHNDISPSQFLLTQDGKIKLNDFNRARFVRANPETRDTCPYQMEYNPGTNRAPEEYAYAPQTEKVDIFSLGNVFYMFLSRTWPFEDISDTKAAEILGKGGRPKLPSSIRHSKNPIHRILLEAMLMCHKQNPQERATAREVEAFFKSKLDDLVPGKFQEWKSRR